MTEPAPAPPPPTDQAPPSPGTSPPADRPTTITQVRGGAGGIQVQYDELEQIAVRSQDTAKSLALAALYGHGVMVDPNLLASTVLDPRGAAKVEALMLQALDGPQGLKTLSATLTARAAEIRLASLRYQATEATEAAAFHALNALLWSQALPAMALTAVGFGALYVTNPVLGEQLLDLAPGAASWLITEHPGIIDSALHGLPSMIVGPLLGVGTDPLTTSRLLASAYPDSPGYLHPTGPETEFPDPPQNLGDLVERLNYRNENREPDQGQLDVQVLRNPDGSIRSAIVDIPGTDTWDFGPGNTNDSGSINDLPTNTHALVGDTTSYERMVAQALRDSGVPTGPGGPPVMLVGHSQGGIVAANAATNLPYNITHVVTAGSPVANITVPDGVHMLSLENNSDVVPHLDARANADAANHTTVTFDVPGQTHNPGEAHSIGNSYLPAARNLDHAGNPSVDAFTDSASAFLDAPTDTTFSVNRYYASRDPQPPEGP